jgi:hypothetical protein
VWGWGTSRSALIPLQSKVLRLMPPPLTQPRSEIPFVGRLIFGPRGMSEPPHVGCYDLVGVEDSR